MSKSVAITPTEQHAIRQIKHLGIARYLSIKANTERTDSVTEFARYIDEQGNVSTNPARYNAGINAKIKKLFGLSVDEMKDETMLDAIAQINVDIARVHTNGMKNKLSRREIRNQAHRLCELGYENYKMKHSILGAEK